MKKVGDLLNPLDKEAFAKGFLKEYLEDGFGKKPKAALDLKVFELLVKNYPKWKSDPSNSTFEISAFLGISEQKVRRLLDELDFLDEEKDAEWCRKKLRKILEKAEILPDNGKVQIQIDRKIVRQYAQQLVKGEHGAVVRNYDSSVLSLSPAQYFGLCWKLLSEEDIKKAESKLKEMMPGKNISGKDILKTFLNGVASSAGNELGKNAIRLAMGLATGGVSELTKATGPVANSIKYIKENFPPK